MFWKRMLLTVAIVLSSVLAVTMMTSAEEKPLAQLDRVRFI